MYRKEAEELNGLMFSFVSLFHKKFVKRYRRHDDRILGLKKNHTKIMVILNHNKCLLPSEIGRMLDIEKGSVTTLIDQLENKKLVQRLSDPDDRRKSQIVLSETGKETMSRLIEQHVHEVEDMLNGIDASEVLKLIECMQYAVSVMQKI